MNTISLVISAEVEAFKNNKTVLFLKKYDFFGEELTQDKPSAWTCVVTHPGKIYQIAIPDLYCDPHVAETDKQAIVSLFRSFCNTKFQNKINGDLVFVKKPIVKLEKSAFYKP